MSVKKKQNSSVNFLVRAETITETYIEKQQRTESSVTEARHIDSRRTNVLWQKKTKKNVS